MILEDVPYKEIALCEIDNLNENIPENSNYKRVCIFGQGFVGLPLALSFAIRGCCTVGVDIDEALIQQINQGITYHTEKFYDIDIQEILKKQLNNKRYRATIDADISVKECNNIIVTVGIPVGNNSHEMDPLEKACIKIGQNLKKNDLVIVRSTVIPGTTEEFCLPILEKESGMKAGRDFYLAYASERIAQGSAFDEFAEMPTVVGGVNEESLKRATELLRIVCKSNIITASSIKAVETSKVFENVQRDVNIAMAQEFARFTEGLGIDIFEVVKLANTHKRVNLLTPGPGVGGYCIPNAYHYLAPKAQEIGVDLEMLKLARRKNSEIPKFIVEKVEEQLKLVGKELSKSKIGVLGLAMKDFSNDDRLSPPVEICKLLLRSGAEVKAFDPVVQTKYEFKVEAIEEVFNSSDVLLVLARQYQFSDLNFDFSIRYMNVCPIIIDTKNMIPKQYFDNRADLYFWSL